MQHPCIPFSRRLSRPWSGSKLSRPISAVNQASSSVLEPATQRPDLTSVAIPSTPIAANPGSQQSDVITELKVVELKLRLATLGLPTSGLKAVLVERLQQALTIPGSNTSPSSSSIKAKFVPAPSPDSISPPPGPAPTPTRGSRKAKCIPVPDSPLPPLPPPPTPALTPLTSKRVLEPGSLSPRPPPTPSKKDAPTVPAGSTSTDPTSLPPIPTWKRGRNWPVHQFEPWRQEELKMVLMANPMDLQLAVLGSAAYQPSNQRALASLVLCRGKDSWVIDAGDDTQRQIGQLHHVRPSKVYRLLITRLAPECVLGLSGLLCSLGAARTRGHLSTDIPVHVYGPEGLAEMLAAIFRVSHTYLEMPVVVVEFLDRAVPEDLIKPTQFNRRARIFRALVPPDQLNPEGSFDGDLSSFMPTQGRAQMPKGYSASGGVLTFDPRAGFLPFPKLEMGNPHREGLQPEEMHWTVDVDISARLTITRLPGGTFAYTFQRSLGNSLPCKPSTATCQPPTANSLKPQEADRMGSLVLERAQALKVKPGRDFQLLKDGIAVISTEGEPVRPEDVITACKPGRRIVFMGSAPSLPSPGSAFCRAAEGADLLVSGAVSASSAIVKPAVSASPAPGPAVGAAELQGGAGAGTGVPHVAVLPAKTDIHAHGLEPVLAAGALGILAAQLNVCALMLARFAGKLSCPPSPEPFTALPSVELASQEVKHPKAWAARQAQEEKWLAGGPLPDPLVPVPLFVEPEVIEAEREATQAAEAEAKARGHSAPAVYASHDFWVQVFEKHDGSERPEPLVAAPEEKSVRAFRVWDGRELTVPAEK